MFIFIYIYVCVCVCVWLCLDISGGEPVMISLLDKCVLIICIINWQLLPEIDSNWGSNERSRQRCIVENEMKKQNIIIKK